MQHWTVTIEGREPFTSEFPTADPSKVVALVQKGMELDPAVRITVQTPTAEENPLDQTMNHFRALFAAVNDPGLEGLGDWLRNAGENPDLHTWLGRFDELSSELYEMGYAVPSVVIRKFAEAYGHLLG